MISNRTTGPGMIKFDVSLPVKVFVLNEEEVPSLTSLGSDFISVTLEFNYRFDPNVINAKICFITSCVTTWYNIHDYLKV